MHIRIQTHMHIRIQTHMQTHDFVTMSIAGLYICDGDSMYVYMYMYIHVHANINTRTHIYIRIYTLIHTRGVATRSNTEICVYDAYTGEVRACLFFCTSLSNTGVCVRCVSHVLYIHTHTIYTYIQIYLLMRGGGLGSSTIFKNLMSPTPRRKWYLTTGCRAH